MVGCGRSNPGQPRSHIAGAAPFRSRRIRSIPDLRKALQGGGRCLRERRLASEQGAPHHRAGRRARWGKRSATITIWGLLPRHLARGGAQLWVNPSFDTVIGRQVVFDSAIESRGEPLFRPMYAPQEREQEKSNPSLRVLSARHRTFGETSGFKGHTALSQCVEAGNIYIVDLDMGEAGSPLDWSMLPPATKPQQPRNGRPQKPVRVALRHGVPSVRGRSRWKSVRTSGRVKTESGPVFVGVVPGSGFWMRPSAFRLSIKQSRRNVLPSSGITGSSFRPTRVVSPPS